MLGGLPCLVLYSTHRVLPGGMGASSVLLPPCGRGALHWGGLCGRLASAHLRLVPQATSGEVSRATDEMT